MEPRHKDRPEVHVNGNIVLYYEESNPRRVARPTVALPSARTSAILRNNIYPLWIGRRQAIPEAVTIRDYLNRDLRD